MNQKSIISSLPEIPEVVVTTGPVTEITKYSAQIQGTLVSAENTIITELGLCWGSSPNPEIGDNSISTQNTGEPFYHTLTDLHPETEYHVRAYGLNDCDGQADWGSNPISNGGNQANMWRTLTNLPDYQYGWFKTM